MPDLSDLVPDPTNRRQHGARNVAMIAASLKDVGAARSIVIDEDNVILAGNGVTAAAAAAGITKLRVVDAEGDELIAVRRSGLTATQKRALALYDNRTAELAEWSVEQLQADLTNGEDLTAFFLPEELKEILALGVKAGKTDPDDVPEERATDIVAGDLFELGAHRLLCGDCTKAADLERLLMDDVVDGLITDPPYSSGGATRGDRTLSTTTKYVQTGTAVTRPDFAGDNRDQRSWISWCERWLALQLSHARVGCIEAVWSDWRQVPALTDAIQGGGWVWRGISVWDKTEAARPAYGRFRPQTEFLVWGSAGPLAINDGRPSYPGVIRCAVDSGKQVIAQKPVAVVEWAASMVVAGGVVCDPFVGSGTGLLSAERARRRCLAAEIEPRTCQIAIDRWEAFTGLKATKVGEAVRT